MIAELEPYPDYREAEGGWLGRIPGHWRVRRMKYLLREIDSRSVDGREQLLRVSQYTGVTPRLGRDDSDTPDTRADSLVGYKRVQPDDLVVNIMLAWNGSLGISRHDGIASPAYCVYRFSEGVQPWYYHALLRSPEYRTRIKAHSTGVVDSRLRLYSDDLGTIEALLPTFDEQAAIVRFLDWANGRLERAIRAKRKVIALLGEQKQAIIHRAVTRGIDSNAPLKPAGIPWLGEIPAHWEVLTLKRVLKRLIDCEHKTAPRVDESDFRVIRTTGVRHGKLQSKGTYCTTRDAFRDWTRRGRPEPGDVVFTREAPAGEACVVPDGLNVCLGQRTVLMKLNTQRLDPEFLVHMIYAGPPRVAISLASQGSTVGHFNMEDIGSLAVLLPPKHEQNAIVSRIKDEAGPLITAMSRLERETDLLQEYRTGLVADVVTGKLDVREAAARLPDDELTETPEDDTDLTDAADIAADEAEE